MRTAVDNPVVVTDRTRSGKGLSTVSGNDMHKVAHRPTRRCFNVPVDDVHVPVCTGAYISTTTSTYRLTNQLILPKSLMTLRPRKKQRRRFTSQSQSSFEPYGT